MYKKISLISVLMILLLAISFTGCTLNETNYNTPPEDLKELNSNDDISEELTKYIKTKDNMYAIIMGLDFIIALIAIGLAIRFLLIDSNLSSKQRLVMVLINALVVGAAIISFDAAHFSGWFVHKYGAVKIPMYEILMYDVVGIIILISELFLYKFMKKKNSENGEQLNIECNNEKWNNWWNK